MKQTLLVLPALLQHILTDLKLQMQKAFAAAAKEWQKKEPKMIAI